MVSFGLLSLDDDELDESWLFELELELEWFVPRLISTGPEPTLDTELEVGLLLEFAGAELLLLALDEAVSPLLSFDVLSALDDGALCCELSAVGLLELVLSAGELGVCELVEPSLKMPDWETAG